MNEPNTDAEYEAALEKLGAEVRDHGAFERSGRQQEALASRIVDFAFHDSPPRNGIIMVGGWRKVGSFKATENSR